MCTRPMSSLSVRRMGSQVCHVSLWQSRRLPPGCRRCGWRPSGSSPKRQVNPAFLLLLVVEERLRQDEHIGLCSSMRRYVFPGCLRPHVVGETVSVLALGVGSSLVCTAGPSGSLPSAVVCRRGWCGGRWGSLPGLACQVWEGLSGLLVPEKIPQVGHDGDLLPGASLVFLTFLAAPVARSAGCGAVAAGSGPSLAEGARLAGLWVCLASVCVLVSVRCAWGGPRPGAGLSVSIRRSRVVGTLG
jgi:hypothetical protein